MTGSHGHLSSPKNADLTRVRRPGTRIIAETGRLLLVRPSRVDAGVVRAFLLENRGFFEPWEPLRGDDYFGRSAVRQRLAQTARDTRSGSALAALIVAKGTGELLGDLSLSAIVRGPFQSCYLGYKLGRRHTGRGYMTEALAAFVRVAFGSLKLHRIEANIMPANEASARVAVRAGFTREGASARYLKINGRWEDHDHYAILNGDLE
ncbi:MAG: GNAT family N-acetyltransferase [Spirochaetia bacterium]|nr:GNAT family N-acetyltransferase [Spirochaetia bacterium]